MHFKECVKEEPRKIPELWAEQMEGWIGVGEGGQVWGKVWGNSRHSGLDTLGWRCRAGAWRCPTAARLTCLVPAAPTLACWLVAPREPSHPPHPAGIPGHGASFLPLWAPPCSMPLPAPGAGAPSGCVRVRPGGQKPPGGRKSETGSFAFFIFGGGFAFGNGIV